TEGLFAASPWERGRLGRTGGPGARRPAKPRTAPVRKSQSGRAGRASGAAIAGFIQDWLEEEAALAELGFTPDGLPDPAVWGEEAITDPEGLLAQIAAGRKPGQPWDRGRSGDAEASEEGRDAGPQQAAAQESKSSRDGRGPGEEPAAP